MQPGMIIFRIAKAMLDDWQNDTCVGKYLKTIWENRVDKENEKRDKEGKSQASGPIRQWICGDNFKLITKE